MRKNYTDLYYTSMLSDNTIINKLRRYDNNKLYHLMNVAQNAIIHYENIISFRGNCLPHKAKNNKLTIKFSRIQTRYQRLHNLTFKALIKNAMVHLHTQH